MTDLQKLKEIGSIKDFKENDFIFRQAEPGDEMYIILSGRVRVYINALDGTPINISYLENGDFFGEISLLEDFPRKASAIAECNTIVIAITKNNFQSFICEPTSISYKIMKGLSHQISQLYNELSQCKSGNQSLVLETTTQEQIAEQIPNIKPEMQDEATPLINQTVNDVPIIVDGFGTLFPEGHKKYNLTASDSYNSFLIASQAKCPVCKELFPSKKQALSKLQTEKMDPDFRKHYKDFEPIWYSLWVCPYCYYTNYYTEYDAIPPFKTQAVLTKTTELKKKFSFQFSEPRTIDQVFTAYYLALFNAELYNANSLKFAKLWLQLSWLYHDVNDEEMFKTASASALKNYYNVLYKTEVTLSTEQAQQCFILLGELYLIKGDEKEAIRHFYTAIKKDGGREAFNQQAEDRIHDIRKAKMSFEF